MKTIKRLASDALEIQDACNPVAVSKSFGQAILDLRDALAAMDMPNDHDTILEHPIAILWVSKLESMFLSEQKFAIAYDRVKTLASN